MPPALILVGARRIRSKRENRFPLSPGRSNESSLPRCSGLGSPAKIRHNRAAARSLTLATSRMSVVTPGSRIFSFTSRAVAKFEQHRRPLRTDPRPGIRPAYQTEVLRLFVEISVVMSPLNLSSMLVAGDGSFAVMQQTRGFRNIQLLGQMGDYYPWYCSRIRKEGSQKTDSA